MKCKNCGNTKEFTKIREIAYWNAEDKEFEDTMFDGNEYYVCNVCMRNNKERNIDTEGDY